MFFHGNTGFCWLAENENGRGKKIRNQIKIEEDIKVKGVRQPAGIRMF